MKRDGACAPRIVTVSMCRKAIVVKDRGAVPCGFCFECRSRYARGWAIRCVHEASLHEESCFGTLTYDDEHLPLHGSLRRRDFQLFMKRWRKLIAPKKMRYYHVGEYGEANGRPHYHFLVFGHMPGGRVPLRSTAAKVGLYRSSELESVWSLGVSSVGYVTMASAMYVAQYVLKKSDQVGRKPRYAVDPETGETHEIEREYSTMSRRPGIGAGWYDRYGEEVQRLENIRVEGAEVGPPRYYDDLLRKRDEAAWEHMKLVRERKAKERKSRGVTWDGSRRAFIDNEAMARELIAKERLLLYSRKVLHAAAPAVHDSGHEG